MMKHKVGDKVKIRQDLIYDGEYDGVNINDEMISWRGEEVTISEVYAEDNGYEIKEDAGCFFWTDSMFEDAMTNADRIRNMNDEGLAELLREILSNHRSCRDLKLKCKEDEDCSDCSAFLDWLKCN